MEKLISRAFEELAVQGNKLKRMFERGIPGGSVGKESACIAGAPGSMPGLGRSPGEWNGNPCQYSCLENSMDRGAQ